MKYGTMTLSVHTVTPDLAARWLGLNVSNRRIRPSAVEAYARDMSEDQWYCKPVAICFDEQGKLGNGQHTLNAIIRSGKSQELLVAHNVQPRAIASMDVGLKRTIADIAHFMGDDFGSNASRTSAVTRVMVWGPGKVLRTYLEVLEAYLTHKKQIDFVCEKTPKKSLGQGACVVGVAARALYTQDESKIARFLEILDTGLINDPSESAAVRLRDFLRNSSALANSERTEVYRKTTSALAAFVRGDRIAKIYGTQEDLFPIPTT